MLTISQLASYAGVTVRAVRHYHAKGCCPSPSATTPATGATTRPRWSSSSRSARSPTPACRCRGCVSCWRRPSRSSRRRSRTSTAACAPRSASASDTGERIAQLAAGDSLALPPEAVAYLDRMRELGFRERLIEVERDSWILIAAKMPDEVPASWP